jgi:hypothetical protein
VFLYHKEVAKRGLNEICSMLCYHILNKISSEVKNLYAFMHSCPQPKQKLCIDEILDDACCLWQIRVY